MSVTWAHIPGKDGSLVSGKTAAVQQAFKVPPPAVMGNSQVRNPMKAAKPEAELHILIQHYSPHDNCHILNFVNKMVASGNRDGGNIHTISFHI